MLSTRETEYIDIGLQYYVMARQAYLCGFVPVGPNQFHHAFEMLLKAKFIEVGQAPEDLKKKYGHSLTKLWTDFKGVAKGMPAGPAPQLAPHDSLVSQVHAWEDVRYPNFPAGTSVVMSGSLRKDHVNESSGPAAKGASRYKINLEAMDELFAAVVAAWPLSPSYIRSWLSVHRGALEIYERENQHPIPDSP